MNLSKWNLASSLPVKSQNLSFFPSYVNYILQTATLKQLLKLYQCSKYFYSKSQFVLASDVWYENYSKTEYIKHIFRNNSFHYGNIKKIWLIKKLHMITYSNYGPIGNNFLNKIHRNSLKQLTINFGHILFREFAVLANSTDLTEVVLETVIINDDNLPTPIEEIMSLIPLIKVFEIRPSYFTPQSFSKLLYQIFSNPIQKLKFRMVKSEFDPVSLCDFLKKHFDDGAIFGLTFDPDFYHIERDLLLQVKDIINSWEKKQLKCLF